MLLVIVATHAGVPSAHKAKPTTAIAPDKADGNISPFTLSSRCSSVDGSECHFLDVTVALVGDEQVPVGAHCYIGGC